MVFAKFQAKTIFAFIVWFSCLNAKTKSKRAKKDIMQKKK